MIIDMKICLGYALRKTSGYPLRAFLRRQERSATDSFLRCQQIELLQKVFNLHQTPNRRLFWYAVMDHLVPGNNDPVQDIMLHPVPHREGTDI